MPRLDNSDRGVQITFALEFDDEDPGETPPVDVCANCWQKKWAGLMLEIEHPPYADDEYHCMQCGVTLDATDDHPESEGW